MLFYVVGLPVGTLWMIRRLKKRAIKKKKKLSSLQGHTTWGMFYSAFREEVWWWEGTVAMRKVGIAIIGVFGSSLGQMQIHLCSMIVVVILLLTANIQPFAASPLQGMLQSLEMTLLVSLWLTLWAGSIFSTYPRCENPQPGGAVTTLLWCDTLSMVVGCVNIGCLVAFAYCCFKVKVKKCKWCHIQKFDQLVRTHTSYDTFGHSRMDWQVPVNPVVDNPKAKYQYSNPEQKGKHPDGASIELTEKVETSRKSRLGHYNRHRQKIRKKTPSKQQPSLGKVHRKNKLSTYIDKKRRLSVVKVTKEFGQRRTTMSTAPSEIEMADVGATGFQDGTNVEENNKNNKNNKAHTSITVVAEDCDAESFLDDVTGRRYMVNPDGTSRWVDDESNILSSSSSSSEPRVLHVNLREVNSMVDPTGAPEWKAKPTPTPTQNQLKVEYMIDEATGNEYYVDPVTGETEWKAEPTPTQNPLAVEYLIDEDTGAEYYIDSETGDAKWKETTEWE